MKEKQPKLDYLTLEEAHEEVLKLSPSELAEYEQNAEMWQKTIGQLGEAALSGLVELAA